MQSRSGWCEILVEVTVYLCGLIGVAFIQAVLVFALILFGMNYRPAWGQQNPNCTQFGFQIGVTCCCSNDCCREAEAGEFSHVGGDQYRSNVTGQVIVRTGWSPDGRTVKCACDMADNGRWFKHARANVRCLWVPRPMM